MAVHNGHRFLPEQISSVLAQLGPQDEIVVVDDASADDSVAWLAALREPRIKVHRNQTNEGVIASFGQGLALSRHPIAFLCDQDDIWLPGKRDAFVTAFAQDTRTLVVISDAQIIDAEGRVTSPSFMATRGGFRKGLAQTLLRNRYLGCAMAVRREVIRAALPIPSQVPMHDMWLGALGNLLGRVGYISTPLLQYRRHSANATPSRRQGWRRMARWRVALACALFVRVLKVSLGSHTSPLGGGKCGDDRS